MTKVALYLTSFCNKLHRLSDGKPVEHECYVLNVDTLRREQRGEDCKGLEVRTEHIHRGLKRGSLT